MLVLTLPNKTCGFMTKRWIAVSSKRNPEVPELTKLVTHCDTWSCEVGARWMSEQERLTTGTHQGSPEPRTPTRGKPSRKF